MGHISWIGGSIIFSDPAWVSVGVDTNFFRHYWVRLFSNRGSKLSQLGSINLHHIPSQFWIGLILKVELQFRFKKKRIKDV